MSLYESMMGILEPIINKIKSEINVYTLDTAGNMNNDGTISTRINGNVRMLNDGGVNNGEKILVIRTSNGAKYGVTFGVSLKAIPPRKSVYLDFEMQQPVDMVGLNNYSLLTPCNTYITTEPWIYPGPAFSDIIFECTTKTKVLKFDGSLALVLLGTSSARNLDSVTAQIINDDGSTAPRELQYSEFTYTSGPYIDKTGILITVDKGIKFDSIAVRLNVVNDTGFSGVSGTVIPTIDYCRFVNVSPTDKTFNIDFYDVADVVTYSPIIGPRPGTTVTTTQFNTSVGIIFQRIGSTNNWVRRTESQWSIGWVEEEQRHHWYETIVWDSWGPFTPCSSFFRMYKDLGTMGRAGYLTLTQAGGYEEPAIKEIDHGPV